MCSNIICHIYTRPLVLRRAQKASPEPPRRKSMRCALMPFTPMSQHCRFRWVTVRFVFSISAKSWRNATVQGRASISQTTPTTTSTHLGPKPTAPRSLHHGHNCTPNWCQRPCYLTSRLWLRPDHHEMHSESNPLLMPAEKTQISMLWSQSLDLKEGPSNQPFGWCTTQKQNTCKILEDRHDAKIEMS